MTERPSLDPLVNLEAEVHTLSCILHAPQKTFEIILSLDCNEEFFYLVPHRELYKIMLEMHERKLAIDFICVETYAQERKKFNLIQQSLLEAENMMTTMAHMEFHFDMLKRLYHKRLQKGILNKYMDEIDGEMTPIEISSAIRDEFQQIKYESDTNKTENEIVGEIMSKYNNSKRTGFVGVPSKQLCVQNKLGGYKKGKLILLAARPSMGKTTFALNETRFQAEPLIEQGGNQKVGIISLETEIDELYAIMAAEKAKIDLFKMNNGNATQEETCRFRLCLNQVIRLPIYATDKRMDIRHIVNWIYYMCSKQRLDIIYIDYIQIIADCPGLNFKNMREKINHYSKSLFAAARDNNVAVVALSQINRIAEIPPNVKIEDRWRYTPKLHHLKESGALEEDAYQAIILYADPTEGILNGVTTIPIIADIAKNKNGPTGQVKLLYKQHLQSIESRQYGFNY